MSEKSVILKRHIKRAAEIFFHQGPKAFFEKVKEKSAESQSPKSAPIADSAYKEAFSFDKKSFEEEIEKYDVISFDVFDTLLLRKYDDVAEIFAAVPAAARHLFSTQKFVPSDSGEMESDKKSININSSEINFTPDDFKKIRIEAEIEAIQEKKASCNIDDIYEKLKKISHISETVSEALKQAEVSLEEDALIERRDMCEIFRDLVKKGKTVIITSDMYLKKDFFETVLSKNGLMGFTHLYVSCEEGLRKDDGTIFEKIAKDYAGKSIIHIGDNHKSDFEEPAHKGINAKWIMNSETELKVSGIEELINLNALTYETSGTARNIYNSENEPSGTARNIYNSENGPSSTARKTSDIANEDVFFSLINGLSRNGGLFDSPFALSTKGICHFTDSYTFGYSAFGPLMYEFMLWLHNATPEDATLYFLAREGYIFIKLYEIVTGEKAKRHKYLLTSRRAVSVAAIRTERDIREIVRRKYDGSFHNLMESRLGVEASLIEKLPDIQLHIAEENSGEPDDFEKTMKLLEPIISEIISAASKERKNYLSYLDKEMSESSRGNAVLVDVGYTGTIQYYMGKLLERPIDACYLAILRNNKKLTESGSKVLSMYKKGENTFSDSIERTQLFLESVLQAPYGQLIKFDSKGNPVYRNESLPSDEIKALQEGMLSYCRDRKSAEELIGIDKVKSLNHGKRSEEYAEIENVKSMSQENSSEKFSEGKSAPTSLSRKYSEVLYNELLLNHDYMTRELALIFKVEDSYSQDTSLHLNPETHRWEI